MRVPGGRYQRSRAERHVWKFPRPRRSIRPPAMPPVQERMPTMILGMTTATYTLIHVLISLIGIGSGMVVMYGLLTRKRLDRWTALFLTTTVLTSVSGFGFPFNHLTPAIKLGIISLVLLAIAIVARYPLHLGGAWRRTYVICASLALY